MRPCRYMLSLRAKRSNLGRSSGPPLEIAAPSAAPRNGRGGMRVSSSGVGCPGRCGTRLERYDIVTQRHSGTIGVDITFGGFTEIAIRMRRALIDPLCQSLCALMVDGPTRCALSPGAHFPKRPVFLRGARCGGLLCLQSVIREPGSETRPFSPSPTSRDRSQTA
jgi:hypothetical protein